jgi:hypothetical protein
MYSGVPSTRPSSDVMKWSAVSRGGRKSLDPASWRADLASPKSSSFTSPDGVIMTFSGLRSR